MREARTLGDGNVNLRWLDGTRSFYLLNELKRCLPEVGQTENPADGPSGNGAGLVAAFSKPSAAARTTAAKPSASAAATASATAAVPKPAESTKPAAPTQTQKAEPEAESDSGLAWLLPRPTGPGFFSWVLLKFESGPTSIVTGIVTAISSFFRALFGGLFGR